MRASSSVPPIPERNFSFFSKIRVGVFGFNMTLARIWESGNLRRLIAFPGYAQEFVGLEQPDPADLQSLRISRTASLYFWLALLDPVGFRIVFEAKESCPDRITFLLVPQIGLGSLPYV